MDSDSDDLYEPSEEECDSSSEELESNSSEEDVSDTEVEPLCVNNWTYVSDPFADKRKTDLYPFKPDYSIHPAVDLSELKDERSCFELFVTQNIVKTLCKWTNERADAYFEEIQYRTRKVFGILWKPVEVGEMYSVFAYIFLMGVNRLPEIKDYWSNNIFCSAPKCFDGRVISRNRFQSIMKFLRFSSPKATKKGKPLTRFAPFAAMLREVCQLIIDPGEDIAIDECLMLYKGRLHFRQYIKTKRARFGLKMFCLCPSDPKFQAYTWNFSLYIGKDIYETPAFPDCAQLSKSERVVVYLAQNLLDQGRHIILDNWYMSIRLAEYLQQHHTYVTGTIRKDRGVPEHLKQENLQKGSSVFVRNEDKLLVRFRDKKDVYVLTNRYEAGMCEKTRFVQKGKQEFVLKPLHIQKYNSLMESVDKADQLLKPYNPTRKSYSWSNKFGIHLLSSC